MTSRVLVLDFGSQYTQLIARRVREQRVYCEILPCTAPLQKVRAFEPQGLILSGGPFSVYEKDAPPCPPAVLDLGVPVLGICYGLQFMAHHLGGKVHPGAKREYGHADLFIVNGSDLFRGLKDSTAVWMSHGDALDSAPSGFDVIGRTANSPVAAVRDGRRKLYGLQFHPEVAHTPQGKQILANFLFEICGLKPDWTIASFIETSIQKIREEVEEGGVLLGLSGGVDSAVAAVLLHKAVGDQLACIFVDNGLLGKGEAGRVLGLFRDRMGFHLRFSDASERFLRALAGVTDPEAKRKAVGRVFIEVFELVAEEVERERAGRPRPAPVTHLAQGTLYPDVIESVSFRGPSATIKSHHNVGGLPERMGLRLLEPFRELFKDEVRELGRELGLPDEVILRQPFPGPGLAVRVLGEVTRERLDVLREADAVLLEEVRKAGLYEAAWQTFCVLLPVKTVGVMGDSRTYENVVAVRAVTSLDGMTADWMRLPDALLAAVSNRVINEVRGVNRVVYDITSKPPGTIEWE
ncbi:MAG: glutamine-hydrolyzing GMP synthase [Candidatus Tectomicrobia bacterium]|nr:glutamine-hydrolyzing GMP synthase [Candidatus Tectomicrobia bacterium]